jgi:hypothetical protein
MLGCVLAVFGGCWAKAVAVVGVKHDHRNAACSIVHIGYGSEFGTITRFRSFTDGLLK